MSVGWISGAVRAEALARGRLGSDGVRTLSGARSVGDAVRVLLASSYGERVRAGMDGEAAQRAIAESALWHLRVLAGWLPPGGVDVVAAAGGWFEARNIEARAIEIAVGDRWNEPPLLLGACATIWPRVATADTLQQIRWTLANSAWGDPASDALEGILLGVRIGWARRLRALTKQARDWSNGAFALAIAKYRFARRNDPVPVPDGLRIDELGVRWRDAGDLRELARVVPISARWVLAPVQAPTDLWRAERLWWIRVDHDAEQLLRSARLGRATVIAAALLLTTDCWRAQAELSEVASARALEERPRGDA